MTLWARLTWQVEDVAALAAGLERRLDVPSVPGGLVPGARLVDLGSAWLELRPWVREGPDDHPRPAGRLMLEPVEGGESPPATGAAIVMALAGFGWATVDLDRSERELSPWLGPRAGGEVADGHLGARVRLHRGLALPGEWSILLEPEREGRAAASLARDGEGPCAVYLRPVAGLDAWLGRAHQRDVRTGVVRGGPLGRQVLAPGPPAGPHVIVTEGRSRVSPGRDAGTIGP